MPLRPAHTAFLLMLDRFEARLAPLIATDKRDFINAAATRYAEHGTPNFFDLVDKHQQKLSETLGAHYKKVIPAFGSLSLSQVKSRRFKDDEESDLFAELAKEWIHREGLNRSKLIADTTEADVLAAIANGMDDGDGVAEIARRIRRVTSLSPFRAELIARTETHAAANYAGIESVRNAEEKLGVIMLKEWLPTIDGRTRPDHAAMAYEDPIPLDDKFLVGDESMDRPGDPSASPENIINCRCALAYTEKEE